MILAVDPGPHTGFAAWYPERIPGEETHPETFDFETLDLGRYATPHAVLWDRLSERVFPGDTLVYERFVYQKEKAQQREHLNFDAAQYEGVIQLWHQLRPHYAKPALVAQIPSQAVGNQRRAEKGQDDGIFWDDEKLQKLGLLALTKTNHERSALRHLLYYITFTLRNHKFLMLLK